jgi:hypothetical protein
VGGSTLILLFVTAGSGPAPGFGPTVIVPVVQVLGGQPDPGQGTASPLPGQPNPDMATVRSL